MKLALQDKDRIRLIISKLAENDKTWLDDKAIVVGNKGFYWVLNYLQGPRNEYNRLVRGMVVQKPNIGFAGDPMSLIKSFPFVRFFNKGEAEAAPIDFGNAEMMEKLDGTMVGVFFPAQNPNDPHFHTRKMVSSHAQDMDLKIVNFYNKEFQFMPIIGSYVKRLKFIDRDVHFTYVFEFIHEASEVLTKYKSDQYGLYLLGARDLTTYDELTEVELDQVARRLGAKRPRRFQAVADHDEILKMFKQIALETPDFEGAIFRDKKTGDRLKVKDPDYVKKHHLLGKGSYANLIPAIFTGEEDEVVANFPHLQAKIDTFKKMYDDYIKKAMDRILVWQETGLRGKDLAFALYDGKQRISKTDARLKQLRGEKFSQPQSKEDPFITELIFKNIGKDEKELYGAIDTHLRNIALGSGKQDGSPKRLLEIMRVEEEPEKADTGEI